ncbi:MAG: MFS transporter [Gelidibacter sp.]
MRFALLIEFVSAIAGAMILVNTIVLVKGGLRLIDRDYELIMAAFGVGATIAAFVSGAVDKTKSRRISLIMGALILGVAISFANHLNFPMLFLVWIVAGLGQSLAEIPSETLIGETVPIEEQGKVYGSHFAFSHLWWAFAYPLAGFLGTTFLNQSFLYGGIITIVSLVVVVGFLRPKNKQQTPYLKN